MFKNICAALLGLLCLLGTGARASVYANTKRLDSLFDLLGRNNQMMGSVTVTHHGLPVYSRQIGFRDNTSGMTLNPSADTKYRIGSISKMFTSVIIMQLIEEGKLSLDTKLSEFYPQLSHAENISIAQMLSHHSGLPHFHLNNELYPLWNAADEDQVLKIAASFPFVPADVINGEYSNLNFILLGFIIEKVTGETYEAQLQTRITEKLGLKDTYYQPGRLSSGRNEAHAFRFFRNRWNAEQQSRWNYTEASGLLESTTADLTKFTDALFGGRLVSDTSLQKMLMLRDDFGLGIQIAPFFRKQGFGHSGCIEGFMSVAVHYPEDTLSVALTINGHVYPMNNILIGVLSIVYGVPYRMPVFSSGPEYERIALFSGYDPSMEMLETTAVEPVAAPEPADISTHKTQFPMMAVLATAPREWMSFLPERSKKRSRKTKKS
jgi:D-alanyl-D-alanine carboxypeptidase